MLIRRHGDELAISQPHHAWISGELARAWGNDDFAVPAPRDAVICGIALHDLGWLDWERAPRLDPTPACRARSTACPPRCTHPCGDTASSLRCPTAPFRR